MKKSFCWLLVPLVMLIGCAMVTIYVTFPEEKIKKAAESIEKEIESAPAGKTSFITGWMIAAFSPGRAYAAEISSDLKTDSPKIRNAAKLRASWKSELDSYKQQGYVGENNQFQVEIRNAPSDVETLKKVRELVKKENEQRKIIIDELMLINNASPEQRAVFQEQFAKARREQAKIGEWIQNPDGTWVQKKEDK